MKSLFLAIQSRILQEVPEITYVRIFNNQFENVTVKNSTYDFPMPCVFVEFENANEPKQLGGGFQLYEPLNVILHLGVNELDSATGYLDQNLNVFDLKDKLYKAMQKFEPNKASIFIRTSEEQDYDHTNIYVWKQTYKTTFLDGNMEEPQNPTYTIPVTDLTITKTIL
jgi:hypothetical protein